MYSIYVYCVHLVYWWSISTGAAVPKLKLELERQGEEVRAEPPCHLRDGSAQHQQQHQHQPTQWHHRHPWPWFERRSCVWIGIARPSRVPSHSSGDFMITHHPFIRYSVWAVPNYSHHRIFVILICSPTLSCFVFDLWYLNMYLFFTYHPPMILRMPMFKWNYPFHSFTDASFNLIWWMPALETNPDLSRFNDTPQAKLSRHTG